MYSITIPMKWPARVLGVVAIASLAGCGGGGGSDVLPTRTAQAKFSNMSALAATSVVAEDDTGKALYTSSIDCTQSCQLTMPNYVPPARLTFKLFNRDGKLVSAHNILKTDRDYFAAPHTDVMLGAYLFKEFVRRYGISTSSLTVKLDAFFAKNRSPDGTTDSFEELGMLYAAWRTTNGYGETGFYSELKSRLDSEYILEPSYFASAPSTPPVMSSPPNVGGSCPWWGSLLGKSADVFGKFIPYVGENVGEAIGKGISEVAGEACDESSAIVDQLSEVNAKLDAIDQKLDVINAKVNALGYDIQTLSNAVYDVLNLTAQIHYRDALLNISNSLSLYRNLLGNNYSSLVDYAQKNGGLAALSTDLTAIKLLNSIGQQNQSFKTLADATTLRAIAAVLANKCADTSKMRGDVITQRGECNLVLANITTEYLQAQSSLALMMKDQVAMVNAAILLSANPASITDRYTSPFVANWGQAQAEINTTLNKNISTFTQLLGDSFVEVTKDIPASVKLAVGFSAHCTDANGIMAASSWYPNESRPYLVTHCYNGGNIVKSKFFYEGADTTMSQYINAMGVVVNKSRNDITDRSTPWQKAGVSGYARQLPSDPQSRGFTVKLDPQYFTVNNAAYPPSWLLEPGANNSFPESCYSTDTTYCDTLPEHIRYVLKQAAMPTDGYSYFTSRIFEHSWDISSTNRGNVTGKTDLFTTFAYTPQGANKSTDPDADTTLVWQVQLGTSGSEGYYHDWRLRCITADCSVDGNKLRFYGHKKVSTVSLDGSTAGWKTFTITR